MVLTKQEHQLRYQRAIAIKQCALILLLIFIPISACTTINFTAPVTSFQESIDTASSAIKTYYIELNSFERDVYLARAVRDPAIELLAIDERGRRTPLLGQTFSAASIKARADALTLLNSYAGRLGV
jgi:hypothetical protein